MVSDEPITRFCVEYHAYNDISARRRRRQEAILREFDEWLDVPILETDANLLSSFLAELSENKAATTVEFYRNMIRPFFTWAYQVGLLKADGLLAVRSVPPPRGATERVPRPYSREQVKQLWRDLAKQYPYYQGGKVELPPTQQQERAAKFLKRWQNGTSHYRRVRPLARRVQMEAIIALALYGGLRLDEIFRLSPHDCDPENEYVSVTGVAKNRAGRPRERAVPWTTEHMHVLVARWLRLRTALGADHDQVWLSLWSDTTYADPMPRKRFELLLTHMGRGWEFHRLRHTAATEMLRASYDIQIVQRVMGHASIDQTLQYAKLINDDILKAATKSKPQLSTALAPPELMIELHGQEIGHEAA